MDERIQMLLEKAKIYAGRTGQAAESAGKKATEIAHSTRLNLQIFDLNTECEVLYKDIGKLVYDVHQGIEADESGIQDLLAKLDDRQTKITALREQISLMKSTVRCPGCGRLCSRADAFCAACGGSLGVPFPAGEPAPEEAPKEPGPGEPAEEAPKEPGPEKTAEA